MNVSVVVPTQPDDPERTRLWAWCRAQYPPAWEIVEAPGARPWSKACVTPAASRARGSIVVIADCDLWLGTHALLDGVAALAHGAPWVVPHGEVYRLTRKRTTALLRRDELPTPHAVGGKHHRGPVGGGFVVCWRVDYLAVGGFDPGFTGWGGEDISFGRVLDTLIGRHRRLEHPCWHLWHQPMRRPQGTRASPENEALAQRYLDAEGHPETMRELVQERRCASV